jgi:hypothetical protein
LGQPYGSTRIVALSDHGVEPLNQRNPVIQKCRYSTSTLTQSRSTPVLSRV